MPEFYAEPLKDRRSCSVCKKTAKEKGKKVLLTCINCHAITYCGRECQSADWSRDEWNCVPVMVTEFPGKGRGLVRLPEISRRATSSSKTSRRSNLPSMLITVLWIQSS